MPVYRLRKEMPVWEMMYWFRRARAETEGPPPLDLAEMDQATLQGLFG